MRETIAIYLRLSQEDAHLHINGKTESESITNQRAMLTAYVQENFPGARLLEFCDDGWSGKNFDRPGVKALIQSAQRGEIQCIVVKDLSRFSRDYIIAGNYISKVFPFLGVRFIALGDGFDSARPQDIDSLSTSFKTLIYDLYSRELSRKVRAAKRRKAEQGDWVCGFVPFGYRKDPENIHHLIADEKAAGTVRRVFQMAIDGMGTLEITRILNMEQVPTPMLHKKSIGSPQRFMTSIHEKNRWMQSAVARILRDERYTGKNIYGRRARDMVGNPHTLQTSRDVWVVVEDAHEAIITQREFDMAQERLRKFHPHPASRRTDRPLRGKIFCGICGHAMARSNGKDVTFYCPSVRTSGDDFHPELRVPETDLLDAVLTAIRSNAQCAIEIERLASLQSERREKNKKAAIDALHTLQGKRDRIVRQHQHLYEMLVDRAVTPAEYTAKKQALSVQLQRMETELLTMEARVSAHSRMEKTPEIALYRNYEGIHVLTAEAAAALLERVTVHPDGVLDVRLNYADKLAALLATECGEAC